MIDFYYDFYYSSDTGKSSDPKDGLARCAVCFDVKKEDAELEEGDDGIGACFYYNSDLDIQYDANFFGRVEATGSSGFKFLDKTENDWDTDAGFLGESSYMTYFLTDPDLGFEGAPLHQAYFVSEPLNLNSNSKKNLGIRKGETFWKCYVGEQDSIDP